ncbi:substrate-binding domain-containing protein [Lacisediminimonas sp.]|uniref:helix-turn-helix transcriptional regulator n=1 Tax=Lacisediminimonas sp. TaxID=3060582 RepID=UPI00271ECB7D|nr:substrate-binding domain-containing protein [Lacisediminimonas sp.]MDO8301053.1 substrate-binding domain-containing protein [Lacisediminimonas sp.]
MLHIKLGYTFTQTPSDKQQLQNPLFDVLSAIHSTGSVAQAARQLGLSYRHVWGAIKDWEATLGAGLILWERGKRARLSGFGEKLLFAEQRAKTRVMPQIENLVAEMEREFALAFDRGAHVISIMASHDLALPRLKDFMAQQCNLHLDMQFRPSLDAIAALSRGECMLAGFHIGEQRAPGTLTQKAFKQLLKPGKHKLINFVAREQGLMVRSGNPKKIRGIPDLARPDVRFVNRQTGSGTRVEIDQLLAQSGIATEKVQGYGQVEPTHLAVAAAIASGRADAGIGIHAAAAQFGLDFIALLSEQYYFACLKDTLKEPAMLKLLDLLAGKGWHTIVRDLPGYDPADAGQVVSLRQALPWYAFRTPKAGPAD